MIKIPTQKLGKKYIAENYACIDSVVKLHARDAHTNGTSMTLLDVPSSI